MRDPDQAPDLGAEVGRKASRRTRARRRSGRPLWLGLGAFGTVGWSVAVPALIGTAVGVWLDRTLDDRVSWTLTGLVVGVAIGCVVAWSWVSRTSRGDDR